MSGGGVDGKFMNSSIILSSIRYGGINLKRITVIMLQAILDREFKHGGLLYHPI